jgi:hypothetical protein
MNAAVRNVLIVLALAGLLVAIPGGGTGANVALQALSLAFFAMLGWFAMIQYREHRVSLYSLGDRRRAALYVSAGVILLTVSAQPRLWPTGAGKAVFLVVLVGAAYTAFAVIWSARRY